MAFHWTPPETQHQQAGCGPEPSHIGDGGLGEDRRQSQCVLAEETIGREVEGHGTSQYQP